MKEFQLGDEEFIPLCDLMKASNLCSTGGEAKHQIAAGKVMVDGALETRKRYKVRKGQTVEYGDKKVKVL